MKRILIVLLLFLSACSVGVKSLPTEKIPLDLQNPTSIQMKSVDFTVINDNICLTESGYKNLLFDLLNIQNFIILQQQVIESYRSYYEKK